MLTDPDGLERERSACAECGREPSEGERFRGYLTIDDEVGDLLPGVR